MPRASTAKIRRVALGVRWVWSKISIADEAASCTRLNPVCPDPLRGGAEPDAQKTRALVRLGFPSDLKDMFVVKMSFWKWPNYEPVGPCDVRSKLVVLCFKQST